MQDQNHISPNLAQSPDVAQKPTNHGTSATTSDQSNPFQRKLSTSKLGISKKAKLIAGLLVLILLVVGIAAAAIMTRSSQDIRNQAAGDPYAFEKCLASKGSYTAYAAEVTLCERDGIRKWDNDSCSCPEAQTAPAAQDETSVCTINTDCQNGDVCVTILDSGTCYDKETAQASFQNGGCGNALCETFETPENCSADCQPAPLIVVQGSGDSCAYSEQCGGQNNTRYFSCEGATSQNLGVCKINNGENCTSTEQCLSSSTCINNRCERNPEPEALFCYIGLLPPLSQGGNPSCDMRVRDDETCTSLNGTQLNWADAQARCQAAKDQYRSGAAVTQPPIVNVRINSKPK